MKIYTQNVCCLPVGAHEIYLQKAGALGAVLALAATAYTCSVAVAGGWSAAACVVAVVLAGATGLFNAIALYAGMGLFGLLQLARGGHDFKKERLAELARRLTTEQVDVVMLQELYGTWYSDCHRQGFAAAMAAGGFAHAALPSAMPVYPALWSNSGLAVFSRHPLSDVIHQPFKSQTVFDKFGVNRGVMGATVDLPASKGGPVRVYTTHFGPPLSVLDEIRDNAPEWLPGLIDVWPQQFEELTDVVVSTNPGRVPVCLGGDFNAPITSNLYTMLWKGLEATAKLHHVSADLLEAEGAPATCNPMGELLLTGGTRAGSTLDYAFASPALAATMTSCEVVPQRVTAEDSPFQFLSDHQAVMTTFQHQSHTRRAPGVEGQGRRR